MRVKTMLSKENEIKQLFWWTDEHPVAMIVSKKKQLAVVFVFAFLYLFFVFVFLFEHPAGYVGKQM